MGDILAFTCITAGKKTHLFPNVVLTMCFKHKNTSIKPMVDVRSAVIPLNGALTAIHNHSMLDRRAASGRTRPSTCSRVHYAAASCMRPRPPTAFTNLAMISALMPSTTQ